MGELSERTGISRKAIRDLEQRGLVYSAGRSESNYRLYDQEALWCVRMISGLRSLGLTLGEIQQFGADYPARPGEHVGPRLAALLERVQQRVTAQLADLEQTPQRIEAFRRAMSLGVVRSL
jgi:DNA-binding transcriptional MerR regulator